MASPIGIIRKRRKNPKRSPPASSSVTRARQTRTVISVDPHVRLSNGFPATRVNCRTKARLGCGPCGGSRLGGLLCRLRLSGLLEQKSESGTGRQSHRDEKRHEESGPHHSSN